jgi:hypothetical protein
VFKNAVELIAELGSYEFRQQLFEEKNIGYPIELIQPNKHSSLPKILIPRVPQLKGHIDIQYNLTWIMFASEPLLARFTAPYLPCVSPAPGVLLSAGEFDIGQWFRPYNLDYHVPLDVSSLTFKEDEPLFYMEAMTDRPIVLKRFNMTTPLRRMADECVRVSSMYGANKPLKYRYQQFMKSSTNKKVLKEIEKNCY